ncbi:uncharacterized protein UHOD_01232 [Ustilago sp. UG-2017b]|nr:uncharacterized protein UHOD_01232 [Ustilago sp. UG-2017b]
MASECATPQPQASKASSSSSSTLIDARMSQPSTSNLSDPALASASASASSPHSPPDSPERNSYSSPSYAAKGKRRASGEDVNASSDDTRQLSQALDRLSVPAGFDDSNITPRTLDISTALKDSSTDVEPRTPTSTSQLRSPASTAHAAQTAHARQQLSSIPPPIERDRRVRKARDPISRSVAPSPLRSALTTSHTTGSASQFASLLGQPVAVSASLSAPDKSSATAASAALPSLYKASRGRSTNVSPSRRWDRRGASASVLSGASASGSGGEGEGDEVSDQDLASQRALHRSSVTSGRAGSSRNPESKVCSSSRRLSVAKEESLFPSDDDDECPILSPTEELNAHADKVAEHRRRIRRWSSIERERRRGMRILLQQRPAVPEHSPALDDPNSKAPARSRGRGRLAARGSRAAGEDVSDVETTSSPSSCASSCDLNYVPRGGDTAAIPIRERRNRSTGPNDGVRNASTSATSTHSQVPSSTDGSDDPSPAASTPSTSLVQRSPPGFTTLKPIVATPVASEADPLLGLAIPSVEDMIQVDKVEFFPEEATTTQQTSARVKRKTSPKQVKKSSWIIGDFESEPESDEEQPAKSSTGGAVNRSHATAISTSPPSQIASSYQARLASLQSQLRIWSRTQDTTAAPRVRQISSSSEGQTEGETETKDADSNSVSLLSTSWRNLARLPNLILLPGLAARQARESLASANKAQGEGSDGASGDRSAPSTSKNGFAKIYRLASSANGPADEKSVQAQRKVALKTGRPPSPSPSPSPPASLLGSRQSSNDSISGSDLAQSVHHVTNASRRGRGVASPLEADRDPSAYVSGLGQPIDPDTELSSVVQLQTFRSRSRSRPADVGHRGQAAEDVRNNGRRQPETTTAARSPKKLGQPIELEPTEEEKPQAPSQRRPKQERDARNALSEPLTVQIPQPSLASSTRSGRGRRDLSADVPAPTDIASAPTSPTFRKSATSLSASRADETDSIPSPPRQGEGRERSSVDADGFRVVRRRHRRRSSGPRSLRPKVDAPVPLGYSAFSIEEDEENADGSDSDGDVTPSPTRARQSRGRGGRDPSPRRSSRQCAVGLFGGGVSAASSPTPANSTPRSRRSGRREGSQINLSTPIRSVRSSPDLTYAAAAAAAREGNSEEQSEDDPLPPRGSRGRRGAVKVVNSSVGQRPTASRPLLLGGLEGLRRGPSYPPRAGEIFEDGSDSVEDDARNVAPPGRGRSATSPACSSSSGPQTFRFRLLSNSSHLLMLSLELDMIKKQKISAPLKPRWGKHRANDFNPLPSTISYSSSSSSSKYLRSPFSRSGETEESEEGCGDDKCSPFQPTSLPNGASRARPGIATVGGGLRDPSSRLRFSWSLADIAVALDVASAAPSQS